MWKYAERKLDSWKYQIHSPNMMVQIWNKLEFFTPFQTIVDLAAPPGTQEIAINNAVIDGKLRIQIR